MNDLRDTMPAIPLTQPYMDGAIGQRVLEVLNCGWLTEGSVTREFEQALADYIGCPHAIAVTSCTTGLEIALRALGIGPGDEVLVPDYTYPATAAVVAIVGATAVLVDVDPASLLVDYEALERAITPATRAMIPVSLFGNPLDHARLQAIRQRHNLYCIEDAACALGAAWKGGGLVIRPISVCSAFTPASSSPPAKAA